MKDYVHLTGEKRGLLGQPTPMTREDWVEFWRALPVGILLVLFLCYGGLEADSLLKIFPSLFGK